VVGLVLELVWQGRINVGTGSARLAFCRDLYDEVGLLCVHVRPSLVIVGTCPAKTT